MLQSVQLELWVGESWINKKSICFCDKRLGKIIKLVFVELCIFTIMIVLCLWCFEDTRSGNV